jgi:hypothetical protein
MYLLHGFAGVLHGDKGLLVDVGRFYTGDLALHGHHLRRGLFEGVFVLFLSPQRCFGHCSHRKILATCGDSRLLSQPCNALVVESSRLWCGVETMREGSYWLYSHSHASARSDPAHPSGSGDASPVLRASQASTAAVIWHSWGLPSSSRLRRRTSPSPILTLSAMTSTCIATTVWVLEIEHRFGVCVVGGGSGVADVGR